MKAQKDMRDIAENLINSYEIRVKTINGLMRQTDKHLKVFQQEQREMIARLRDNLARSECLRKKDFDTMMEGICLQQQKREKELTYMLERFQKEEEGMIAKLRDILAEGSVRPEVFRLLSEEILIRRKEREKELTEMLRDFHLEQQELKAGLKGLLGKGQSVKIRDFKSLLKGVQSWQGNKKTEVSRLLDTFWRIGQEVGTQWQKVIGAK